MLVGPRWQRREEGEELNETQWCGNPGKDVSVKEGEVEDGGAGPTSILVTWGDCIMADYFTKHNPGTILEYTVEISPETEVGDM